MKPAKKLYLQLQQKAIPLHLSIHSIHSIPQKDRGNKATFDRSMAALAEKVRNYGVYVLTIWPGTLVYGEKRWWVDFLKGGLFKGMRFDDHNIFTDKYFPPKIFHVTWKWVLLNTAKSHNSPPNRCVGSPCKSPNSRCSRFLVPQAVSSRSVVSWERNEVQLDSLIWKPYASQAAEGGMLGGDGWVWWVEDLQGVDRWRKKIKSGGGFFLDSFDCLLVVDFKGSEICLSCRILNVEMYHPCNENPLKVESWLEFVASFLSRADLKSLCFAITYFRNMFEDWITMFLWKKMDCWIA